MSDFRLEIALGNEAMRTREDVAVALYAVATMLTPRFPEGVETLALASIEDGDTSAAGKIRDANGNTVGRFTLTLPEP